MFQLILAVPAFAENSNKDPEMQRVIEAQQRQLEAQQRQIEELTQMLTRLQSDVRRLAEAADEEQASSRAVDAPAQPASATATPTTAQHRSVASSIAPDTSTEQPSKSGDVPSDEKEGSGVAAAGIDSGSEHRSRREPGVAQTDRFDEKSPTNVDASYFDPTAVINVPGTETSVGLHGFAQFQIIHDSNGPAGNQFDTAFIPVDGAPSETKFNVNPSRIAVSSVTPVTDGQLNTLISMDFNGQVDRPDPRLRLAYGEFANQSLGFGVLGGQTFATMTDLRAVPETVDFAVPAGSFAQRQPLLRFTKAFYGGYLLESSLETPQNVRYINAEKRTRWPDVVMAGTWIVDGDYLKHLRLSALGRDLRAEGADGTTDSAFGWAIAASAKVDLPFLGKRDNLRLTVHHGEGYGTQLKGGPEEAIFNATSSQLDTIGISSLFGGIQHYWSEKFRSNLTYGYVNADNPASAPNDALDSTTYASANLVWNPYKQLTLGTEYLWGQRKNVDGASGTSNRFLFSSRYDF